MPFFTFVIAASASLCALSNPLSAEWVSAEYTHVNANHASPFHSSEEENGCNHRSYGSFSTTSKNIIAGKGRIPFRLGLSSNLNLTPDRKAILVDCPGAYFITYQAATNKSTGQIGLTLNKRQQGFSVDTPIPQRLTGATTILENVQHCDLIRMINAACPSFALSSINPRSITAMITLIEMLNEDYGSFSAPSTCSLVMVEEGENIPFTTRTLLGTAQLTSDGKAIRVNGGVYSISYSAATTPGGLINIAVNGTSVGFPISTGIALTGATTIIKVNDGDLVSLRNEGSSSFALCSMTSGSLAASLTLYKID